MSAPVKHPKAGDREYKALLGHTVACTACRSTGPCPTAVSLARSWRKTRR